MEEIGANLDDGELWIPSDIFPTEEQPSPPTHHHNRPTLGNATSLDDLSRQFSNFNILDHHPVFTPSIPQQFGVFGRMAQYAVTTPTPNGCYGLTVGPMGVDHGHFNYDSGPVHQTPKLPAVPFPMHTPVYPPTQVAADQLMETRTARISRPMHRQQQNRVFPIQAGSGCGFGIGYVRDCCSSSTSSGTGVFIPRTMGSSTRKNNPGVTSKTGAARKLATGNRVDYHRYRPVSSSEVALPKDWSY